MSLHKLLRHVRQTRRLSQLDLAMRLDVSQRHVSYVESGRARPSRELLIEWLREVEAPPSIRSAALLQAGFAPETPVPRLQDAAQQARAIAVLEHMLRAHEPFPGLVFSADWHIVEMNRAGRWLAELLMPELWRALPDPAYRMDMIAALAHPDGLLSQMRDAREAGFALLSQLRAEQWVRPALRPRIDAYEASLRARFGPLPEPSAAERQIPYLNLVFDSACGVLSFFTIESIVGLPQDVTTATPRVELWFPADRATREVLRAAVPDGERDC